jgi:hypothetical protein
MCGELLVTHHSLLVTLVLSSEMETMGMEEMFPTILRNWIS